MAEQELFRLIDKYGRDTVVAAFGEVQDYVERLTRARIADLPDGSWETEDHIDFDPGGEEGLVAVRVKMTIEGDEITYDLDGSDPAIANFLNAGAGVAFSGAIASAKTFLPEIPLNSGFYRAIKVDVGPEGTIVNAGWPNAVTGCVSGAYEKIMNAGFELWSELMPERAMACCFNLEYLLVGGRDARRDDRPFFMWYDWMAGGWGGRNGPRRAELHVARVRRRARGPAVRGPGAADAGPHLTARDHPGLRRARQAPRRLRRAQGRHADRGRGGGHVLLLRPLALGHLGDRRRPAVGARTACGCNREGETSASWARTSPACPSAPATASSGPRPAAAGSATRWSATPRRCSRTSRTAT